MDLDALGHADILRREAASSRQDPEAQSYCSPTPTLTQQHTAGPHKGRGRALPTADPAVGIGSGGGAGRTVHEPGTGLIGPGGSLQAPNPACSWLLAWLWPRVICLGGAGSRAAAGSDASASALPGAYSSGISARVPRRTPLAHPHCPEARPRDAEPGEPPRLAGGELGLGKLCEARAQAAWTAHQVAFRSLNISSCGRTWHTPGSQRHRSQTVNRWVLPA